MNQPIKIIDLFSGPGGLGEGFSALKDDDGNSSFKIAISIEKEKSAHRTLKLRAFSGNSMVMRLKSIMIFSKVN